MSVERTFASENIRPFSISSAPTGIAYRHRSSSASWRQQQATSTVQHSDQTIVATTVTMMAAEVIDETAVRHGSGWNSNKTSASLKH
jgi:hypothetical protein